MTLTEIRNSARSKADEEATGFISDTALDRFINQGLRFVYGKIVQAFEDYFLVEGTVGNGGLITVTSGTNKYSLPATMLKLVRVERRNSGETDENQWVKLNRVNIANGAVNDFYPIRPGRIEGPGYFITGSYIFIRPVPTGGFNLRLWFVPRATALSASSDEPTLPVEYHELIAEYAAIQCLAKSGEGIFKERNETFNLELANLIDTISHRVQEAEQMVITDDQDYIGGWD